MQELISGNSAYESPPTSTTKAHVKGRNRETIGAIVAEVIHALQPLLVKTVTTAVSSAVKTTSTQILQSLKDDKRNDVSMLKCETQKQKFELDRLEQYSRKDSIRISGSMKTIIKTLMSSY